VAVAAYPPANFSNNAHSFSVIQNAFHAAEAMKGHKIKDLCYSANVNLILNISLDNSGMNGIRAIKSFRKCNHFRTINKKFIFFEFKTRTGLNQFFNGFIF
jgi:hypothetical protein